MSHPRRFRFGVQVIRATSGDEWRSLVRRAEDAGYATVSMSDHLFDQLAPLPALTAAAAATTEIRLTANVLANDFRHPALLAKEAATLDVLSDGRLELGLGAGWLADDYAQTGIPFDSPGTRIERLAEAVAVIRGLWADGPYSLIGAHYRIDGLDGTPKPVQRPAPPILLGGGGRRMLSTAARLADIVGIALDNRAGVIGGAIGPTDEAARQKVGWIRAAAPDRWDDLELSVRVLTHDGPGPLGIDGDDLARSPHALTGSVDALTDRLYRHRDELGVSYYVVSQAALEPLAPLVERLTGR